MPVVRCPRLLTLTGCAALLFGLGAAGCAPARQMPLEDFVQLQSDAELVSRRSLAMPATVAVDDYLTAYQVGPGDVLSVALTGLNEPTVTAVYTARVDHDGQISLPLVSPIPVAGLSISWVEEAIHKAYVPAISQQLAVNVTVNEYDTTDVFVTGAVQTPGLVQLRRSERNVVYAVAAAGGISDAASGNVTLYRIRRPTEPMAFDLSQPLQLQQAIAADPLRDGDFVLVAARQPNTVFVGGLVNRPGPQTFPPGVRYSVLQVLANAGGRRSDVTPRVGHLVRRMPNGEDLRVELDLDRIQSGEDANVVLAAGDILWVPNTVETRVQEFLNNNIFLRAGVSVNYNVTGSEFLNSNAERASIGGSNLENAFDPFGFLQRNTALQGLGTAVAPTGQ